MKIFLFRKKNLKYLCLRYWLAFEIMVFITWALMRENLSSGVCEQQMCRPASLISIFVIPFLESIISKLAIFKQVSVAEETGLSLVMWETLKTGFVSLRHICIASFL